MVVASPSKEEGEGEEVGSKGKESILKRLLKEEEEED